MFSKRKKTITPPDLSTATTIVEAIAKKPRRWYIPEGCAEEYYLLVDKYDEEKTHLSKYHLWAFLYRVIPDLPEDVVLNLPSTHIMHPYVEEGEKVKA